MKNVSVIGAGSWGTALAFVLAENGHNCLIWSRRQEQTDEINEHHTNSSYLNDCILPESLRGTSDLKAAVDHADILIVAVPTKGIREIGRQLDQLIERPVTIVHVSKGIEPDTQKRITEMLAEEIRPAVRKALVVLSGPSHAEEVVLRHPTTVSAASDDLAAAEEIQNLFMNSYFRVYTNQDVLGVELGGALKNVIALAAGITDGLAYGDNAKAALITRGLAEITRLGVKMGANPSTFAGLAGMGDLIVTANSVHSRNWRAGNMLGKGQTLEEVTAGMGMVIEGVRTTKAAHQLAAHYGVSMPLTEALYSVLFEGHEPREAVDWLMNRDRKKETDQFTD
ncbi:MULTISPECIES: NAD(P)H-dependent glycerol-3-phosphate dehydrogenase [Sporosarcina]|uniref:NAD(P)H-dependent glycerol-3-phosphate dehydrogenase n=1 Tax=Sporosarcina TaxID=1569 RepID=UPI00058E198B|nr:MULTISPECIES: NAD(P)H-dependent glycerol-3-phosphate dehydrogenase [Sporosarcina]WJY28603.1 NAD(P)H-dependent glycerol-3-phosphate dehydrogenase [Sporosarcina sp. 0.2-SM1T-5]